MARKIDEQEIWTTGRRGSVICVNVLIYPHSIVATSDGEHITERMMKKALKREFPRHTFHFNKDGGDYLRCDAGRWTDDGMNQ